MLKPIAARFVTIIVILNVATFVIAANSTLPAVAVAWAVIIIIPSSAAVVLVAWIVFVALGPVMMMATGVTFHLCCGKCICSGCICAMVESGAKRLCAYCRTPPSNSDGEQVKRVEKLMEKGFNQLAGYYRMELIVCHRIMQRQMNYIEKQGILVVMWHIITWEIPMT